MPQRDTSKAAAVRGLELVSDALVGIEVADPDRLLCALASAREQAERSLTAFNAGDPAAATVVHGFAGALLGWLASDPGSPPELTERALAAIVATGAATPVAVGREALSRPSLLALEPQLAGETVLALISACAAPRSVSLWGLGPTGQVWMIHGAGSAPQAAAVQGLARALIAGEPRPARSSGATGLAIERAGLPMAAIVAVPRRGGSRVAAALLQEAAGPIAAILERETLLVRNASSERALVQASERRLTRLGFDLHDGPLQELLLVGEDLALFREQLAIVLEGRRGKELLGGRLDDLDARLVALERGLRRISTSVHAGVLVSRPFPDAVEDLIAPFHARTGIEPLLTLQGDLEGISPSQRVALLSVVGEALNNIREHSGAEGVEITIVQDEDGVRGLVRDDGRGFDVEAELLRAARRGHMGLAGVYERVRLLGGHCRVESRDGGPSEIAVALPRWQGGATQPLAAEA
jgi:signal transduction histidine kinase